MKIFQKLVLKFLRGLFIQEFSYPSKNTLGIPSWNCQVLLPKLQKEFLEERPGGIPLRIPTIKFMERSPMKFLRKSVIKKLWGNPQKESLPGIPEVIVRLNCWRNPQEELISLNGIPGSTEVHRLSSWRQQLKYTSSREYKNHFLAASLQTELHRLSFPGHIQLHCCWFHIQLHCWICDLEVISLKSVISFIRC